MAYSHPHVAHVECGAKFLDIKFPLHRYTTTSSYQASRFVSDLGAGRYTQSNVQGARMGDTNATFADFSKM